MSGNVSQEFAELMLLLAESCGASLSETRIRTYALLLHDVPIGELRQAVYRCARERDQKYLPADSELRFPTTAELRAYIVPCETDAALIAWAAFLQAAGRIGAYASLAVEDQAAVAALMTVYTSWPEFCAQAGENAATGAKRAEFLAAYRAARRQDRLDVPTRLPGLCEATGVLAVGARVWLGQVTARGEIRWTPERPQLVAKAE